MMTILRQVALKPGLRLQLAEADLTREKVDAIVNAANPQLIHGGGVAGAIVSKGGSIIQKESYDWVRVHGPVTHEDPAVTSAGNLPSRYVIHAVGPVWGSGDEDDKLTRAVQGSLRVASEMSLRSISLPAISTGIFGYPKARAARVIFGAIRDFINSHQNTSLQLIRLALFDRAAVNAFTQVWDELFSNEGGESPEEDA